MKKAILSLAFAAMASFAVHANSLTAINTTSCYIMISTQGGYIFLAPSGMTGSTQSFPSPANIASATAPPSGTFDAAKVINDAVNPVTGPWTGVQINVGTPPQATFANSTSGVPCHGGTPYGASWIVGSTGDITLVIV